MYSATAHTSFAPLQGSAVLTSSGQKLEPTHGTQKKRPKRAEAKLWKLAVHSFWNAGGISMKDLLDTTVRIFRTIEQTLVVSVQKSAPEE